MRTWLFLTFLSLLFISCGKKTSLEPLNQNLENTPTDLYALNAPGVKEIIDLSYNWHFKKAYKKIDQLEENNSDPLLPGLLKTGTLLWEFVSCVEKDHEADVRKKFNTSAKELLSLTQKKLIDSPNDIRGLYVLGFLYGGIAKIHALDSNWFKAYRYGIKSQKKLNRVLELSKNSADARFGVGLFRYYCATYLPSWTHRFAWLLPGLVLDREGGYQQIVRSSKRAELLRIEAQYVLGQVNTFFERDYDKAISILSVLEKDFSDNALFQNTLASAYFNKGVLMRLKGEKEEALKNFEESIERCFIKPKNQYHVKKTRWLVPGMKWKMKCLVDHELYFLVMIEKGRTLFYDNDIEESDETLLKLASNKHLNKELRAAAYFEIGRLHYLKDLLDAKKFFKKSEALSDKDVGRWASKVLKNDVAIPKFEKQIFDLNIKALNKEDITEEIELMVSKLGEDTPLDYKYILHFFRYNLADIKGEKIKAHSYFEVFKLSQALK